MSEWCGQRPELSSLKTQKPNENQRGSLRFFKPYFFLVPVFLALSVAGWTLLNNQPNLEPIASETISKPTPSVKQNELARLYETRIFIPDGTILLMVSLQAPLTRSDGNVYATNEAFCNDSRGLISREVLIENYGCFEEKRDYKISNLPALVTSSEISQP